MPKDTSVLPIQWRYLSLDESENDKCRTTVEMFALCRNKPSTYRALLGYYYEIKNPAKRLTPDSDQKGPIRHYVQEWNRVATEAKVGCHPLNEDGCSYGPSAEGSSRSRPHRVCQRPVGPGRTVEHWINRRLAIRLFPFLSNPDLWVEPPSISQQKRGKRGLNSGERPETMRKKPRHTKQGSTPSTREPTPADSPSDEPPEPSSSESGTEHVSGFSMFSDVPDVTWEGLLDGDDPVTAFSMLPSLDAYTNPYHAQNITHPSVDDDGINALIEIYKPLDNELLGNGSLDNGFLDNGSLDNGSDDPSWLPPHDGYLPEDIYVPHDGSVPLSRWRPDRPRFGNFNLEG
jgi:hypothetical protein